MAISFQDFEFGHQWSLIGRHFSTDAGRGKAADHEYQQVKATHPDNYSTHKWTRNQFLHSVRAW